MKKKCNQCKYEWNSRKKNPKQCPKCKRYDWNEVKKNDNVNTNERRLNARNETNKS